jgi:hypothetical protein
LRFGRLPSRKRPVPGVPAKEEPIRRAVDWLKANQRASGRWFTRSMNQDTGHVLSNAGTAFAVMALRACDVRGGEGQSQKLE